MVRKHVRAWRLPGATALLGLLTAASPPSGIAAEAPPDTAGAPVFTVAPVRVEASRMPPSIPDPGFRTVLDRDWLDRTDPEDLAQALVGVAGLRILDAGDGLSRSVSMRGLAADRVAILVDGRALNTAQGGGVDLEPLDLDTVERVEITRGAMSALYGPGALGGAVNLVSRLDRLPGGSFRFLAGTEDRALLRLRYGLGTGRWTADGALRAETASPKLGDRRSRGEGAGGNLHLAVHPRWAAAVEAGFQARRDARDVPGNRHFPTPEARRTDTYGEAFLALRGAGALGGLVDLEAAASRMERHYLDPSNPLGAVDDIHLNRRERVRAGWKGAWTGGGTEIRSEAVRDRLASSTDGDRSRDRGALTVTGHQSLGGWGATAAARSDVLEGFAPHASARVSVTRTLAGTGAGPRRLAVRAGAGNGFRPPTFDDLFWPARAGAAGNADLRPERSRDLDLGLEAQLPNGRLRLAGFASRVRDLIQWSPGPDGVWRPHNVGRARIDGLETEGSIRLPDSLPPLRLEVSASWTRARDDTGDRVTGGKQLVGRPQALGFGELSWEPGAWSVAAGVRGVGRIPLTAANSKWTEPYALLHARLRWQVEPGLRLDLEGKNLLDTAYEDIRGYASPGRELLAGIRYTPGAAPAGSHHRKGMEEE